MKVLFSILASFIFIQSTCLGQDTDTYVVDLEMAEDLSMTNNRQLLSLRDLYRRAKSQRFESISKWFPELSAISQLYNNQEVQFLGNSRRTFVTQLSLTQAIFSTEKYFDVKVATLQMEHMKLLVESLENDVLYDVRTLYYKIALDYELLAIAKEHVAIWTELSKQLQTNYDIGTQIILNVNQSKVAIANATSVYYQRVRELKTDMDALAELMGYEPGEIRIDIADRAIPLEDYNELYSKVEHVASIFEPLSEGSPLYKEGFPETQEIAMNRLYSIEEVSEWEGLAKKENPMLRSRLNEVAIADEQVKARIGDYFPRVQVVANVGGAPDPFNFYPTPTIGSQEFQWGVGLELRWMLFDGLGRESRLNQSRYTRSSKEYDYYHNRQSVTKVVRDQIYAIEESVANYVTARGNVSLSDQALFQARDQFDIGYITIYDFQIAVNNAIESQTLLSRSAFDLVNSYYGLKHISGADIDKVRKYGTKN